MLRVWGSQKAASRLDKSGTAITVVEGKAYQMESSGGKVSIIEVNVCSSTFPARML